MSHHSQRNLNRTLLICVNSLPYWWIGPLLFLILTLSLSSDAQREARGHWMVGAGVHSLCIPQMVFSTLGHTVRDQFSSPWLHPLSALPTHPPTIALSSTGWKIIIPAELVVPLVRLRCGEAWPASQTLFASVPTSSKPVYTSFPLYECIAGKIHDLPIAELQSSSTLASIWLSQFLQSMRKRPGERGQERSAWCLLGLSSAAAIWFPFHVLQKGLNGIRGNLEFLGYFSVVCPRWSEE